VADEKVLRFNVKGYELSLPLDSVLQGFARLMADEGVASWNLPNAMANGDTIRLSIDRIPKSECICFDCGCKPCKENNKTCKSIVHQISRQ
jgi:hypothetical protein